MTDEENLQVDVPGDNYDVDPQIIDEEEEGGLPSPDYGDGSPPDFLWVRENQDRVIVTIYAYKDPRTNRLKSISAEPVYLFREAKMVEVPIESEWIMPSKTQLDDYRSRALRYSVAARGSVVSRSVMEELLVKYHLKKLSFIMADNQKSGIELKEGKKGGLTNQSVSLLKSLHASVMELLFIKFIDETSIFV
jgi:hypothetical protein